MIGLVPTLVPFAGIDAKQDIGTHSANYGGGFFGELGLRGILQHAVVITHPRDVFFRSAQ